MAEHEHAYLICENKCLVEGVPKAQYDDDMDDKADVNHNHDSRYYTESEIDAKLAGISTAPVGTYLLNSMSDNPDSEHYKLCNGASLLRADYPELFEKIGTTYGSEDSTHFNLPDWRDKFMSGSGGTLRSEFGQTQTDAIRNINGNSVLIYGTSGCIVKSGRVNYGGDYDIDMGKVDANSGNSSNNPMAGHANGEDIHPTNMVVGIFIRYR